MVKNLLDKNRDPMADRGQWMNQQKLDRKAKERAEKQQGEEPLVLSYYELSVCLKLLNEIQTTIIFSF